MIEVNSGGLRNAIPREGTAVFSVTDRGVFLQKAEVLKKEIIEEFQSIEKELSIRIETIAMEGDAIGEQESKKVIQALYAVHNGVFRMSPDVEDLVEASNNVARVELKNGDLQVLNLTRSSVESSKMQVANQLKSVFELAGIEVQFSGSYPDGNLNQGRKS